MFFLYLFGYLISIFIGYKLMIQFSKRTEEEKNRTLNFKELLIFNAWFLLFLVSQFCMIAELLGLV
jgi:hypothetical protein